MTSDLANPAGVSEIHVTYIVVDFFQKIDAEFQRSIPRELRNVSAAKRKSFNLHAFFIKIINNKRTTLEVLPAAECFNGVAPSDLLACRQGAIDSAISIVLRQYPLDDDDRNKLRELAALFLHRDEYSDLSTGLVFAGFGENELFPSLHAIETDGVIGGKLKMRTTNKVDIHRTHGLPSEPEKKLVDIIPFAQTDMAERFLDGIDPVFSSELMRALAEMHERIATKLETDGFGTGTAARRKASAALRDHFAQAHRHFESDVMPAIRRNLRRDVEDMVLLMPKQDLAFVAEALVNLTSIRRRVSNEEETVGGPIDVAVISKGDGFIWVRRKHYFDPTLNPRYMERVRDKLNPYLLERKRNDKA